MKLLGAINPARLFASLLIVATWGTTALRGQTLYWDTNGATAGAGATPTGTWSGAATDWTASTAGTTATTTWTSGNAAVFSAGTDATNAFAVTVAGTQTTSGITVEEGSPTFTGGTISLSGTTPTISVAGNTTTIGSLITGTGGLTKSGAGTLVLSAANTYTGTTSLSAGTLEFDNDSALNNTVLAIAGGTIQAGGGSRTLSDNITTTGDFTIGGTTALTLNGSLSLGGGAPRTITVTNTAVTTINGSITEPWYSSFVKAGTGQLVLAGNNTFSGLASVTAGTLTLANSNALGATGNYGNVVASGATLELQGGITINEGGFNIDGTGVGGNGAIRNVSGNNSLGGQIVAGSSTTIASVAGTLTIPGVLNTGTAYTFTTTGSGNFVFSGQLAGSSTFNKNDTGTMTFSGGSANNFNGTLYVNAGTLLLSKTAADAIEGPLVIGDGTGTDTVQYGAANQIPDYIAVTVNSSGVLNLNGFSDTIGNLTLTGGSVTTGAGTLTIGNSGGNITTNAAANPATISGNLALTAANSTITVAAGGAGNDLAITAIVSGTAQVTKAGAGTLVLSGANTFTGTTTLNAGTLRATTSASALGAGSLTIAGGTLQLANDTGLNFARNTTVSGSANIASDRLTAGAGVNHTLGTLSIGAQTLSLSAGANVTSGTAGLTFGATTLTGATVFDVAANANLTLGALTGNYAFTKQNSGTLTLNSSGGARTGGVTVSGGTLALGNTTALGATTQTITLAGGALDLNTDTSVGAYPVSVTANSTIFSDKATANSAGITHTLGTLAINGSTLGIQSGGNVTANSAYGVTIGATTFGGNATLNVANNGSGTGTLTLGALGDGGTARTFTKTGTGALTLGTAATSLVNGTAINLNAGTINSNNATALGSLANVTLQTGATLSVGASQTLGALNGTDGAVNLGANTLTVGNATNNLASSYGGAIAGTGGNLIKAGTGTFTLTGANTYTGTTTISAGALQIGAGSTTGSIGTGSVTNNASLVINRSDAVTLANAISGSGSVTQAGAGTTTLSAANTYSGTTYVNAGILQLGATNALASTSTLRLNGGTFATNGFSDVVNTLYLAASSTIDYGGLAGILTVGPGNGAWGAGTLSINNWNGNLTGGGSDQFLVNSATGLTAGLLSNITFSGYAAGAQIISVGSLFEVVPGSAANSYTWNLNANGNWSTNGNWNPATGNPNAANADVTFGSIISANRTVTLDAARTAGYLNFNDNNNYTIAPAAAQRLTMSVTTGSAQINVTSTGSPTISAGLTLNNDLVISQDNASGTLTLSAANAITAGTANGNITVNGAGNTIISGTITTGTGALTKNEAGTLTLSGANTYSGGTTITGGTLVAANNAALGSGTASVVSGATLGLQGGITLGSGIISITGAGYSGSNGALDNRSGNNTVSSGLILTGTTDTTFGAAAGTQLTINGTISQSGTGNLYTGGTGTIVLGGNNSYTGITIVSSGATLVAAANNALSSTAGSTIVAPGNTLGFQGGINYTTAEAVTVGGTGVAGRNGAIDNISGNNTFAGSISLWDIAYSGGATIGAASGTQLTLNGVVSGSDSTAALTVGGAGTIVLGNSNTYTGTTTVNAGATLVAASNNALGTGAAATTVAAGGTLGFQGGINYSTTQAVTVTGTGVGGNGAIDNLAGNNAFAGTITLGAGGATIGAAGGTTLTLSGAIGGTQPLTKAGTGTVSLTGAASYSGATAINAGTLKLGAGGSAMTGGSAVTIASGATFDVENGLTTNSIGTLTANAGSTLTIGSGTLITTGGTLAGSLAGTGTLKTSGNLAVTSNSAFSGTLQTTGGTLDLSGAGSGFSVSSLTLGAGTTLKLGSNPLAVGTLNITGASTIDFGNGVSATLSVGTFNLGANTISVTNWVNGADYFYAQNWTGATLNVRGSAPENQVSFAGSTPSYPASATAWLPYDAGDSDPTKRQITPAPEPATYGAIFMGLSLLGLGLRRWRSRRP